MTQHVRKSYRNHRGGAWAAALVFVALVAAALTPLATGAAPKYYTLTASPEAICFTGSGQTQTFTFTLTNKSRNNSLGSANITAPPFITLTAGSLSGAPTGSSNNGTTIRLRNLGSLLATMDDDVTVTVSATINSAGSGSWSSVAKQANDFADSPGPGNLFTLQGSNPPLNVAECQYVFTQGPADGLKNAAQTVTVELRANGDTVPGTGSLNLVAYQGVGNSTTALVSGVFTGLSATAGTTGTWTFSNVVGTVSGVNYRLRVQNTNTFSSYFGIFDCIPSGPSGTCNIDFTPNVDESSGGDVRGTGIGSGIALLFEGETAPSGAAKCALYWGWSQLTFPPQPPDNRTTFDGLVLSDFNYTSGTGFLKITTYLRNDLFVQTSASQTNDVQVCAGGRHSVAANNTETVDGGTRGAFMGRDGIKAKWDTSTNLYWGVLARIPNCNKSPDLDNDGILDPALCAWGTVDIDGVLYRTATVRVPFDWDWKGVT